MQVQILIKWQFVTINLNYVTAVFLNKIHNCNEFNHPYSTVNNALNIKAYNYSIEDCCKVTQKLITN